MNRILPMAAAMALAAAPALAQTTNMPQDEPGGAPSQAAPPGDNDNTSAQAEQSRPAPQQAPMHRVRRSTAEEHETAALNALEANGYSQFQDLHAQGDMVVALATRDGKSVRVEVTRDGQVHEHS